MTKLYNLKLKEDFKANKKISNYLNPDYIYIPFSENVLLENKARVKLGEVILEDDKEIYTSSISGKLFTTKMVCINNVKTNAIAIENDFKESKVFFKTKEVDSFEKFIKSFKEKYLIKKLNKKNISRIVINCIEDEPYSATEKNILKDNIDNIFDTIDLLNLIYSCSNNYVVLKNNELGNITTLLSKIGTHHNINLIILKNLYLIGREDFLLEKLNFDKDKTIILKPSDVVDIRNYINFGFSKDHKYISVINTITKKTKIINTKKYIKLSDLKEHFPEKGSYLYLKNGLLSGTIIDIDKEIITNDFNSLYIVSKDNKEEINCINCGKCKQVCPLDIDPKNIMDKNLNSKECIDCGLCSYFCPAHINLRKYLKKVMEKWKMCL